MKRLILETTDQRVYGMTGPGHEGRIQRLEKTASAAASSGLPFITGYVNGLGPYSSGGFTTQYVTDGTWTTNNSTIFDPGASSQSFIREAGVYLITLSAEYVATSSPGTGAYSGIRGAIGPQGFEFRSLEGFYQSLFGGTNYYSTHHLTVGHNFQAADVPAGFAIGISHTASVTCTVDWMFTVVQVNPTPTTTSV